MSGHRDLVMERQEPLRKMYRGTPEKARIVDRAEASGGTGSDPFHTIVLAGEGQEGQWRVGIHRAVGGFHDLPNPGDILCAALASCLDSTLRIVAARLGVPLEGVSVAVNGEVDVRGALAVDADVPVGFQLLRCRVDVKAGGDLPAAALERLVGAAERACIVLNTLRHGVTVEVERDRKEDVLKPSPGDAVSAA